MAQSPQEVLVQCRQHDVKAVSLNVTDALGKHHRLTIPVTRLTEESFEDGFAWTIEKMGQQRGEVGDVLLIPQPGTATIEPFAELPTLSLLCAMHDPLTREEIPTDPRTIALKALKFARESGVADHVGFTLTVEFFLYDNGPHQRGRRRWKGVLDNDALPSDAETSRDFREAAGMKLDDDFHSQAMQALCECGIPVAAVRGRQMHRHKCSFELSESDLVVAADQVMIAKQVIKRMAARYGKSATFMPVPQLDVEPAGLATRLALLRYGSCVLSGGDYAGLSEAGLHAIGGILRHTPAMTALCCSTTNSYARLATWHGGLPWVAYSQSDQRAALRVPTSHAAKAKSLEYRLPDAASNPYLALASLLMAAVDGIQNKIHPGPALDPDPYDSFDQASTTTYQNVPASLDAALAALSEDAEFLLRGDVFSPEFIEVWIAHKRIVEVAAVRSRPHPHEIALYYDA